MVVQSSMSGLLSAIVIFVTNFIIEIPEVGVQLAARVAGNTALVYMTVCASVGKRLHTLPSHPIMGQPQRFS